MLRRHRRDGLTLLLGHGPKPLLNDVSVEDRHGKDPDAAPMAALAAGDLVQEGGVGPFKPAAGLLKEGRRKRVGRHGQSSTATDISTINSPFGE